MTKVTLKWGGKATIKDRVIGTWDYDWDRGSYKFSGKTNDGKKSELMKKRELREWFAKEASQ